MKNARLNPPRSAARPQLSSGHTHGTMLKPSLKSMGSFLWIAMGAGFDPRGMGTASAPLPTMQLAVSEA
ncbi:unnamed protein product [Caretta caretta]